MGGDPLDQIPIRVADRRTLAMRVGDPKAAAVRLQMPDEAEAELIRLRIEREGLHLNQVRTVRN